MSIPISQFIPPLLFLLTEFTMLVFFCWEGTANTQLQLFIRGIWEIDNTWATKASGLLLVEKEFSLNCKTSSGQVVGGVGQRARSKVRVFEWLSTPWNETFKLGLSRGSWHRLNPCQCLMAESYAEKNQLLNCLCSFSRPGLGVSLVNTL